MPKQGFRNSRRAWPRHRLSSGTSNCNNIFLFGNIYTTIKLRGQHITIKWTGVKEIPINEPRQIKRRSRQLVFEARHHTSLAKTYTKNRTLLFLLFDNQIVGHDSQSTTDIELRPRIISIALSELTLTHIYLPRSSVILPSPHIEATPPTPYHNKEWAGDEGGIFESASFLHGNSERRIIVHFTYRNGTTLMHQNN